MKRIDIIGNYEINDFYVATNNLDKIYFSDSKKSKIILTDFDFKLIKDFGTKGSGIGELDTPYGLLYHNYNLYVCDSNNRRITILDSNLKKSRVFCNLDFVPLQMKMLYFSACIKEFGTDRMFFYNSYSQSIEYDHLQTGVSGPICEAKSKNSSRLYALLAKKVNNSVEIKFYNDYGELDEGLELTNPYFEEYGVDQVMNIECFHQDLIIALHESKRLLIV